MPQLVWLITGCTSGFGEEFVHQILSRGDHAIATGRKLEKLKHLEKAGASILQLDITDKQQSLNNSINEAINIYGRIDVLVNNAAYVAAGTLEDLRYEDILDQFDTNVFGTMKVTKAILPYFRQKRSGTIVFIGSLAGWYGDAFTGAYSGTKFTLEGLVEGLSRGTAHLGIRNLLIEPGMFRTKLLSSGNLKTAQTSIPYYEELFKSGDESLKRSDQAQRGDIKKGVKIILDLVRQEGCAANREIPLRFPLGPDTYNVMKTKCEETLKLLEEWEPVIKSTDH
ncbi:hypothetical protein B7463_g7592, partial [Scytalidium lignicola]